MKGERGEAYRERKRVKNERERDRERERSGVLRMRKRMWFQIWWRRKNKRKGQGFSTSTKLEGGEVTGGDNATATLPEFLNWHFVGFSFMRYLRKTSNACFKWSIWLTACLDFTSMCFVLEWRKALLRSRIIQQWDRCMCKLLQRTVQNQQEK